MRRPRFEEVCIHPFYLKKKKLCIHPDDRIFFFEHPAFFDKSFFSSDKVFKPFQLGMIYGYEVFVQDDMQIMLLSMNGGKSVED